MNQPSDTRDNTQFAEKWQSSSADKKSREEWSIFVKPGDVPRTQRQFSLYWYAEFIRQAIKGRGFKKGIELGCGRGTASLYLHKVDGLDVTLVDVSPEAVHLAQENFGYHSGRAEFIVADSAALPCAENSFDLVTMIGLLEHFTDYRPALRECLRVLRPGGMLVTLNIPKKNSVQNLNDAYRWLLRLNRKTALKKDYFRNEDTAEQYVAATKEVGFVGVAMTYVNPFPLFVPVSEQADRRITTVNRWLINLRRLWRPYPFATGKRLAQAHFVVATKFVSFGIGKSY